MHNIKKGAFIASSIMSVVIAYCQNRIPPRQKNHLTNRINNY